MSDYTPLIDYSAKDALSPGDSNKKILGADIDAELAEIATHIATKYDSGDLASQAQAEAGSDNTVLMTPLRSEQHIAAWAAENAGLIGDMQALADPGADRLLFWDDSAGAAAYLTPTEGLAIDTTNLTLDINGLTALSTLDIDADYALVYDASAGAHKKVLLADIADAVTGTIVSVYKTANETITSSTTLQDDDELSITLASGQWAIEMMVIYTAGTTGDLKITPAMGSGVWHHAPASGSNLQYQAYSGTANVLPGLGTGTLTFAVYVGYVSSAGATYTVQWAQNASDANSTIVRVGSYIRAIKVN